MTAIRPRGRPRDDTTLRLAEAAGISRRAMQARLKREREQGQVPIDANGTTLAPSQVERIRRDVRRWRDMLAACRSIERAAEDFGADVPIDGVSAWLEAHRPRRVCGACRADDVKRLTCFRCNGRTWEP